MKKLLSLFSKNELLGGPIGMDLKRLNGVQKGLGDAAIAYVGRGDEGSVLSTLANIDVAKTLELDRLNSNDSVTINRWNYIARQAHDAEVIARYGEVLSAAMGSARDFLVGTKHVPQPLRVLFANAGQGLIKQTNRWPREMIDAKDCALSPEFAAQICVAAGGSAVDLFDVVFNDDGRWASRDDIRGLTKIFDFSDFAKQNVPALLEAGRRMAAEGKVNAIAAMERWEMFNHPDARAYLVEACADSSKAVRKMAVNVLMAQPEAEVLPMATDMLTNGKVAVRGAMVDLLAGLRSEVALNVLRDHLPAEKTARIKASIESALAVDQVTQASTGEDGDDNTGYIALDGTRVDIPPLAPLASEPDIWFGDEDKAKLIKLIEKENEEIERRNANRSGRGYRPKPISTSLAGKIIKIFNGDPEDLDSKESRRLVSLIQHTLKDSWTTEALSRMAPKRALRCASVLERGFSAAFNQNGWSAAQNVVVNYVNSDNADYRHLEAMNVANKTMTYGPWGDRKTREIKPGDLLRSEMASEWTYYDIADLNSDAIWPLLAESFDLFDEAFGMRPPGEPAPRKVLAVQFLNLLPKTPQRYYGPLLELATGTGKTGRALAREMLKGAPGLEERAIALLEDTRQDVRAGAAEWLADLGATSAAKPLKARLKKEKSDLARAAILTALSRLGVELSDYVGPKALLAEAEKVLKKAKFDKLDWLISDHMPALKYKGGQKVPPEVIKAWLFLANKLKQPGGNALFDIYLDQLAPDSARTLSTWVFDAWIDYDTQRPPDEEAHAYAEKHADSNFKYNSRWIEGYTRERAYRDLFNGFKSNYLNSGAATKGVLGLAKQIDPAHGAAVVRTYLKQHGSRTSQASALLDVLAAKGDPLSLQIVISAATRLKQKGVQAYAGELVNGVAEARNWSLDELADRTIPTAGLNDDGVLELPIGDHTKPYFARMDDDFKLVAFNPDGKPIKALPAGDDDNTKASKKQLSASKRELKQVMTLQGERLYEALCAERVWPVSDWQRDFRDHPLMGRLTERVIWLGVDGDGNAITAFRPTAEGDYVDAEDNEVDPESFANIRLAHGALLPDGAADAWKTHLSDYEVKPLFAQFGRPLLAVEGDMAKETQIKDRHGWVTDTFTFRGVASKLGYERGEALDGGYFNEYVKNFRSAGLCAVIEFSGNCLPEENVAAAQMYLSFHKIMGKGRRGRAVPLGEVPGVLLSECWNDYRDMVAKGSYDPEWMKKMPWI